MFELSKLFIIIIESVIARLIELKYSSHKEKEKNSFCL